MNRKDIVDLQTSYRSPVQALSKNFMFIFICSIMQNKTFSAIFLLLYAFNTLTITIQARPWFTSEIADQFSYYLMNSNAKSKNCVIC